MRQSTTIPLAMGEVFKAIWYFKEIIREPLIDYVRGAATHIGTVCVKNLLKCGPASN